MTTQTKGPFPHMGTMSWRQRLDDELEGEKWVGLQARGRAPSRPHTPTLWEGWVSGGQWAQQGHGHPAGQLRRGCLDAERSQSKVSMWVDPQSSVEGAFH